MSIVDRLKKRNTTSTQNSVPQNANKSENKLLGLSQSELAAITIYNAQTASQMYGMSPNDMVTQVRNNLKVQLEQGKIHQFTENNKPDRNIGQHIYVAALPVNPNIAPTSRTFMQNSDFTPLDNFAFLQEQGLQFNSAIVSAMMDVYQNRANDINISQIFGQFREKEKWVLNEDLEEVQHFFGELARIFNVFSKNETPIGSFVNINSNAISLIILFDMLNIEYFTLLYNWIVAQDAQAMHNLLVQANAIFESIYLRKQKENYQMLDEETKRKDDLFMKSTLSLYERIRYFQKCSVVNSVFGEKNQNAIQSFIVSLSNF